MRGEARGGEARRGKEGRGEERDGEEGGEEKRKDETRGMKGEEKAAEKGGEGIASEAAEPRIAPWKESRALYTNAVSGLPFRATPDTPPLAAAMLLNQNILISHQVA